MPSKFFKNYDLPDKTTVQSMLRSSNYIHGLSLIFMIVFTRLAENALASDTYDLLSNYVNKLD